MKTRIYKYRLDPTPMQTLQLGETAKVSRFLWNRLVKEAKNAIYQMEIGKRASIENEYRLLLGSKKIVGNLAAKLNKLKNENDISAEDAMELHVSEKVEKDIKIVTRKKDKSRCIRWSNRHLAWKYAMEKVNSERGKLISPNHKVIWTGIQKKWGDFGKKLDDPKDKCKSFIHKKYGVVSAIQKQIAKSKDGKLQTFTFGEYVNLNWCGSSCLEKVKVIYHRNIPQPSSINQVALKMENNKWFVCIFVEAEDIIFQRKFTQTGKTIGIDPGMKSALTTSDGEVFQPIGISSQDRQEGKLKRLRRKLDRQMRSNNPHCYNMDGTWKRGQKITIRSKGMIDSAIKIANVMRYFKDAKADYYHNVAIKLLNQYDIIGIGNVKIYNIICGEGSGKRSQNRKIREHAISDFISKLNDKANLSLTPKQVFDNVSEVNTTKRCSVCKQLNGPSGKEELNVRKWTCKNCGTSHDRDINAACNIRDNTLKELTNLSTAAAQAVKDGKPSNVHNLTKQKCKRVVETKVSQDIGPMSIPFASVQVTAQTTEGVRIPQLSVTEPITKVNASGERAELSEMIGLSQSQIDDLK